jgi:putative transposase
VPICRALSAQGLAIAPRTYWARKSRPPSRRAARDAVVTGMLAGVFEPGQGRRPAPESLYGAVRAWGWLRRQGISVARCTVERIMRASGWRGNVRGPRKTRTTSRDPAAERFPDLVKRQFRAQAPGRLLVADFTYVPLAGGGFACVALVIDAYAGTIRGWECSVSKTTVFVQRAIRQAAAQLARLGHPLTGRAIHHSDAGSQYTSVRFTGTLMLAGLAGSIGTVGDACDNALAETTIGLYKSECVRDGSPFRGGPLATLADVEKITSSWVHWYNNDRLMHRTGLRPPPRPTSRTGPARHNPHPPGAPGLTRDPRGRPPGPTRARPGKARPGARTRLRPPAPCQARLTQQCQARPAGHTRNGKLKSRQSRHHDLLVTQNKVRPKAGDLQCPIFFAENELLVWIIRKAAAGGPDCVPVAEHRGPEPDQGGTGPRHTRCSVANCPAQRTGPPTRSARRPRARPRFSPLDVPDLDLASGSRRPVLLVILHADRPRSAPSNLAVRQCEDSLVRRPLLKGVAMAGRLVLRCAAMSSDPFADLARTAGEFAGGLRGLLGDGQRPAAGSPAAAGAVNDELGSEWGQFPARGVFGELVLAALSCADHLAAAAVVIRARSGVSDHEIEQ